MTNLLEILSGNIHLSSYQKKIPLDHQKRILKFLGWKSFDNHQHEKVISHITWLVQRQSSPKSIFLSVIDFCRQNKIELPSYNTLATSITQAYNYFGQKLTDVITNKLTQCHREKLDQIAGIGSKDKKRLECS